MSTVTPEELRGNVVVERPHVMLLGAGASLAALPNGDRDGRSLPLMNNLVSVLGLEELLGDHGVTDHLENFEALYGTLASDPQQDSLLAELQERVYDYFAQIELPDEPTLYDQLVLSLRKKDLIATFNWDPLLCQAYDRNRKHIAELPSLCFLHGSVIAGPCPAHPHRVGLPGLRCPDCKEEFQRSPLLYPVEEKNYAADPFIAGEWKAVTAALNAAHAFTVFGYSAPVSDVEAKALLHRAWDTNSSREMLETEIIDIKPEAALEETWDPFFYSHHYTVAAGIGECSIGLFPRRSCEALSYQNLEARWVENTPMPLEVGFDELHDWLEPYLTVERAASR